MTSTSDTTAPIARPSKLRHWILPALALASFAFLAWHYFTANEDRRRRETLGLVYAEEHVATALQLVEEELISVREVAENVAADLSDGSLSQEDLNARMLEEISRRKDIFTIGAGFDPKVDRAGRGAPAYMWADDGRLMQLQIEDYYDYTDESLLEAEWFTTALHNEEAHWVEPHFDEAEGEIVTQFAVPFFNPNRRNSDPIGALYVEQSLDNLTDFTRELDIGEEGYSYIISAEGRYIAHPDHTFLGKTTTEMAEALELPELREDSQRSQAGEPFMREELDFETGSESWLFHAPIQETGWTMATVIEKAVYPAPPEKTIRDRFQLGLGWMAFLILANLLIMRQLGLRTGKVSAERKYLWAMSILASTVMVFGLIWFWLVIGTTRQIKGPDETLIVNRTELNELLERTDEELEIRHHSAPIKVPTGILVKNVKFGGVNEANVAGFLWQKYPLDLPEDFPRGVIFPDALDPEGVTIDEVYRFVEGDTEVVGWNFRVALRQSLSYSQYPLDRERINIELWPLSLGHGFTAGGGDEEETESETDTPEEPAVVVVTENDDGGEDSSATAAASVAEEEDHPESGAAESQTYGVMLVPDLDSYEFSIPLKKPGIAEDIHLEEWDVTHSYFSYVQDPYNTNFGSRYTGVQRELTPDLFFNIGLRREVVSPLIAHGVTILVVLGLMFAVLLVPAESSYNVLTYAAALFFVVVISHVGLRGELAVGGVVYLEAFYLALYALLLFSSLSGLLMYSDIDIPHFNAEDMLPRLLYWPLYLAIILLVTLGTFYPREVPPDPFEIAFQTSGQESATEADESIQRQ